MILSAAMIEYLGNAATYDALTSADCLRLQPKEEVLGDILGRAVDLYRSSVQNGSPFSNNTPERPRPSASAMTAYINGLTIDTLTTDERRASLSQNIAYAIAHVESNLLRCSGSNLVIFSRRGALWLCAQTLSERDTETQPEAQFIADQTRGNAWSNRGEGDWISR